MAAVEPETTPGSGPGPQSGQGASFDAAAHLKTIRSLMERATVYRALSAPAALAAGLLTLLVCGKLMWAGREDRHDMWGFMVLWMTVLGVVTVFNLVLLQRSARKRGELFWSAGMKLAIRSVAPPLVAGFGISLLGARAGQYTDVVSAWILFYGLALLAMGSFAPRSLMVLGVGFFVCGLAAFTPWVRGFSGPQWPAAMAYMALTFGGLHVIYAVAVFLRQRNHPDPDDSRT